jgi:phage terminase large subunit
MIDEFDWKNPLYAPVIKRRMETLQRVRDDPKLLGHLKTYYRDNPWDFVKDWGVTYDPRNVKRGLPAAIPFLPFPKQVEWMKWVWGLWKAGDPGVNDKSRDLGVSWLAVSFASTLAIFHDGFAAGFGSRKEEYVDKIGSPKALFWKARKFLENLPPEFRAGHIPSIHAPHLRIMFPETGSVITGEAGDNIGRGDRASIYFVDEAAYLERPMLVEASLSATTDCRIDISSANGMANPFAVKRHSYPDRQVFTLHWRDDPRKDDAWYQKQCDNLDPVTVAQEIDINYAASVEGVIIPSAWVQSAVDSHIHLGITPSGQRIGSLDVADEGIDKNAFASAYGILVDFLEEWSGVGSDIFQTVVRAFGICDDLKLPDFTYDADGMGAGVRGDAREINNARREKAKETGIPPRLVNLHAFWGSGAVVKPDTLIPGTDRTNGDYYENLKAQNWGGLRHRFRETHRARTEPGYKYDPTELISLDSKLPLLSKLVGELSQPTWERSKIGKMVVNKKPDGSKSPNLADVVMMLLGGYVRRRMVVSAEAVRNANARK